MKFGKLHHGKKVSKIYVDSKALAVQNPAIQIGVDLYSTRNEHLNKNIKLPGGPHNLTQCCRLAIPYLSSKKKKSSFLFSIYKQNLNLKRVSNLPRERRL